MILLLLRRSSPRTRAIIGAILMAAGVTLIAMTIGASTALPVHGIIVTVIGATLLGNGVTALLRTRAAR